MTEAEALSTVQEGLIGPYSIPVRLREGRGLDGAMLARLRDALATLTHAYARTDRVPKVLAMAFVDITGSMQANWDRYPEDEQDRIEDATNELVELAWRIFDSDGEDDVEVVGDVDNGAQE